LPLALACLVGACATSGPPPEARVAVLGGSGAVVETIDGRYVRDDDARARFEIDPGRHTVEVSLPAKAPATPGGNEPVPAIAACFGAVAGHSYLAKPIVEQGRWRPEIVDETTGEVVGADCAGGGQAPASAVASLPVAVATPSVPDRLDESDLPGTGLHLGGGFFFGGDSLYEVTFTNAPDRTLSAGRGVLVSAGASWTPLWATDRVGFGLGAALGWKYDSIEADNGWISLTRLPLSFTMHSLIRFDERWFTLVGLSLLTELGGHLSGKGFAAGVDTELSSSLGWAADAGLYRRLDWVTVGGGLRYTNVRAGITGTKVDASSVGIVGAAQYEF
jgi:hypothetical protein